MRENLSQQIITFSGKKQQQQKNKNKQKMCQAFWKGSKTIFALQHKFPSLPETDFQPKRFDPQTLRRCDKTGWRNLTCNIGPSS